MDAFEASSKLTQTLRNLNPLIQNLTRAAYFALKNHEGEDYLFQAILDTLDDKNVEIHTKSTIFQFIEVLVHESNQISEQPKSHYNYPYIHNVRSSLPQILLKVLPGSNNANLHNIFSSLKNLSKTYKFDTKDYVVKYLLAGDELTDQELANVEQNIPFPQVTLDDESSLEPLVTTWNLIIRKKKQSQYERLRLLKHGKVSHQSVPEDTMFHIRQKHEPAGGDILSKKQILSRMEDDRESYKRSKESLWTVSRPKNANKITEDEFLVHYWNKIKVMNDDENKALLESFDELNKLVARSYKDKQF